MKTYRLFIFLIAITASYSSSKNLIYNGGFEINKGTTISLKKYGWDINDQDHANYAGHISLVSSPVCGKSSHWAVKFQSDPYPDWCHSIRKICGFCSSCINADTSDTVSGCFSSDPECVSCRTQKCLPARRRHVEITKSSSMDKDAIEGTERWYSISYYFEGFPLQTHAGIPRRFYIMQYHNVTTGCDTCIDCSPVLGIKLVGPDTGTGPQNRVVLFVRQKVIKADGTDLCVRGHDEVTGEIIGEKSFSPWQEKLSTDTWYDIMLHIKWSQDTAKGLLQGWIKRSSDSRFIAFTLPGTDSAVMHYSTRFDNTNHYLRLGLYWSDHHGFYSDYSRGRHAMQNITMYIDNIKSAETEKELLEIQ